jgi:hypothetical protein
VVLPLGNATLVAKGGLVPLPGYQVSDWLVRENRIRGSDGCFAILKRIPGKPDARMEVSPIGVIDRRNPVIHLNQ